MFAAVMMPQAVPMGSGSPDRLPAMQMSSFASSPFRPSRPSPLSSSPTRAVSSSPPSASSQLETQSSPIFSSQQQQQQQPIFGCTADASANSTNGTNSKLFRFASRPTKQVARGQQARDAAQQTRRSLFLRNVRQRADDRGWERRNFEQELQRMEYFSTEEEFRRARAAEAAELVASQDLDEEYAEDSMMDGDERIADLLAMEEEAELERLLALEREQEQAQYEDQAMLPEQVPSLSASGQSLSRQPSSVLSSDDGEYDDIFAELASAAEYEDTDMDL